MNEIIQNQSVLVVYLGINWAQYVDSVVNDVLGTTRVVMKFPNGYGASVVLGPYTYGGKEGLFELAVLDSKGDLCYTTPITSDVLGYLAIDDVEEALRQIMALEPEKKEEGK